MVRALINALFAKEQEFKEMQMEINLTALIAAVFFFKLLY